MSRTLQLTIPHQHGDDVTGWQKTIDEHFASWKIDYPISIDGDYGAATRAASADLLYGMGIAQSAMKNGITPELRIKVRKNRRTPAELARFAARKSWRSKLRAKHTGGGVALPVAKILTDTWGYHPGVHDGEDLICFPAAPIYAIVRSKVIDVRSSGWWGKAPSGDISKGDGIIQLEVLEDVGPFKVGMHIGYGHAEGAVVKVGQVVDAGTHLGHAGLAVAWHVHFMVNGGQTMKGIGDRDPRPFVEYAKAHA